MSRNFLGEPSSRKRDGRSTTDGDDGLVVEIRHVRSAVDDDEPADLGERRVGIAIDLGPIRQFGVR